MHDAGHEFPVEGEGTDVGIGTEFGGDEAELDGLARLQQLGSPKHILI